MDKILENKDEKPITFEEYLNKAAKHYERRDVHINEADSNLTIRSKDMDFGIQQACTQILKNFNNYKAKDKLV